MNKIIKSIFVVLVFTLLLMPKPVLAATASAGVSAPSAVNTGSTFTVTITASASEAYDSVEFTVTTSNLTITRATASGSWPIVGSPISFNANSASFGGGNTSPQSGSRTVMTLTVRAPSSTGNGTITAKGKVALASNSAEVSTNTAVRTVKINPAPTAAPTAAPTPTPKPLPGAISISSTTHPDQNIWYKATTATFNWTKEAEVTDFSYIIDTNSATTPDDNSEGGDVSKSFDNLPEGINYFHIKAKNSVGWGPASHFKFNIDKTSPEPFTITVMKENNSDLYRVYFATNDKNAGIQKYTVTIDGESIGDKTSDFTIPASAKEVKIIATDAAGNTTESLLKVDSNTVPTQSNNVSTNTSSSSQNNNLWITLLGILSLLLFIYGFVLTGIYLNDKGYFSKNPKATQPQTKPESKSLKRPETSDSGIGESPLK